MLFEDSGRSNTTMMLNKKTKCYEDTGKFLEHDNKFKRNWIEVRKGISIKKTKGLKLS